MKPKLAFVWFVVSLALTALLVVNWQKYGAQKILLERLQMQVEKLESSQRSETTRSQELEKEAQKLRGDLRATELDLNNTRLAYNTMLQMTNAPRGQSLPASRGESTGNNGGNNMGAMLGNMMKDPAMRKALEAQQRVALDMVYGSLFKDLKLTPEQEGKFKDALINLQMTNMAQAGALFDTANTNRAAITQKLREDRNAVEEQIKQVLGEEKFAQYQDYNQTMAERMTLDQFSKQTDLNPEQKDQLLAIMREEKKNGQINSGIDQSDPTKALEMMQSGQGAEQLLSMQEQVNQRVLERAAQVLNPEQLQKFSATVTNQLAMQRFGMKMARQMMGGTAGPGEPPKPVTTSVP